MSIRVLGSRIFKHGQIFVRNICRRDYNSSTIAEKVTNIIQEAATTSGQVSNNAVVQGNFIFRNVGLQVSLHARRIFIDNVLNRVTNSLASELKKKAAKRIFFGDSRPFLALIGVSLASGTGILTKEEELEGICWEIREAISKFHWNAYKTSVIDEERFETEQIALKDLKFGQPIAKGANAVVYAANLKSSIDDYYSQNDLEHFPLNYPLAIKMMFNYDIQSNALAILRAMYRETVPAQQYNKENMNAWEIELHSRKVQLPLHQNIVQMFSVFTDHIPELEEARRWYPAALPPRIFSEGEGRNMSLFLVMKRYSCSLQQYLSLNEASVRISILLLAQLLEGITHMNSYGVAHRDLKSDNLLIDLVDESAPVLVISDFGCCLADKDNGLMLPYTSFEIDRGGNTALMAPEIITQTPGSFSVLNYTKSDLWAAGTIAYEIFGGVNPFYADSTSHLKNFDYNEDQIPNLPEKVPLLINALIRNILSRNPNKRMDSEVAANILQLYLWAPKAWLSSNNKKLPSSNEILQWLLCLTTKILCEGRLQLKLSATEVFTVENRNIGRRTYSEYLLIASFLRRAKLSSIRKSLTWIYNNDCGD